MLRPVWYKTGGGFVPRNQYHTSAGICAATGAPIRTTAHPAICPAACSTVPVHPAACPAICLAALPAACSTACATDFPAACHTTRAAAYRDVSSHIGKPDSGKCYAHIALLCRQWYQASAHKRCTYRTHARQLCSAIGKVSVCLGQARHTAADKYRLDDNRPGVNQRHEGERRDMLTIAFLQVGRHRKTGQFL